MMVGKQMQMMDEVGMGNLFDYIGDLPDFPQDNNEVENGNFGSGMIDENAFPPVWMGDSDDLSGSRIVRYEDIVQLGRLSDFVQDSYSRFKIFPISHVKRARSKRPRPSAFTLRAGIHIIPATYFAEARHSRKNREPKKKKRGKIKTSPLSATSGGLSQDQNENPNATMQKKCTHCEITKTPQWREGPMGPKTLCNACGVRYRKGQLFPEYRPVASPTFVPSIHSNYHRKVVELRSTSNSGEKPVMGAAATSCLLELPQQTRDNEIMRDKSVMGAAETSYEPELPLQMRGSDISKTISVMNAGAANPQFEMSSTVSMQPPIRSGVLYDVEIMGCQFLGS